tara:strand:+ start:3519 stop:4235 length:717 start_codon:yes stop_codon:yes gene_type:complete
MKIACWSGPRNISTAIMRSWSSRKDTFVSDEPLYAPYLNHNKLKHPMAGEIINHYPNTYKQAINMLLKKNPKNKKIWYQKHMAHHIVSFENIDWIKDFENCFLIRHPKKVISSYTKKNDLTHIDELGYLQQLKLIKYLKRSGCNFFVIDSDSLIDNPRQILKKWCQFIGIDFDEKMLRWEKKIYSTDGIWAKHWYDSVLKTEGFNNQVIEKEYRVNDKYKKILKKSLKIYNQLLLLSI